MMDIIEFVEDVLDLKLLDYQKDFLTYIYKHPDVKIVYPRGRTRYSICDYIVLYESYKNYILKEEGETDEKEIKE